MRIAYLHQYFVTPDMAGGSRSYEMARRLVEAGHEVHMITSDRSEKGAGGAWRKTDEAGIHVHWTPVAYNNSMSYGRRMSAFVTFAWRASRRAASLDADIVFATSTPLTIAFPAVYAARRQKVPMVFEVRDLWPSVPIALGALRNPVSIALAKWLERFAYRNSARIVALAPGMRDEVVASGYPSTRVSVIPNGCDLGLFSGRDGQRLRQQHAWLSDRPLVVYAGTFGRANGVDYLARLAASSLRKDPDVRFVAIGSGAYFDAVRELARELGVLDRNLFLFTSMPKNDVADWFATANMTIALLTGPEVVWRDAVQNKFFDSLAAGTPVANNFMGWQAKVAREAGAGIVLDAQDEDQAARDLVSALRDIEWMNKAASAARELAETRFDRQLLAQQLNVVLEDAAKEASA